jgi:hypothetical protein
VAQKELEFVHYDFHDKNILINPLKPQQCAQIKLDGNCYFLHQSVVKIADFGLSTIKTAAGKHIYNVKNPRKLTSSSS